MLEDVVGFPLFGLLKNLANEGIFFPQVKETLNSIVVGLCFDLRE
jgi:hypothetical protein